MSRRNYNDKFLNNVDLRKPLSDHPIWQDVRGVWLPVPQLSGGSTLFDLSPYGNHGTLNGMDPATDWVATDRGLALDFDGSNDYVTVPRDGSSPPLPSTLSAVSTICASTTTTSVISTDFRVFECGFSSNRIYLWYGDGVGYQDAIVEEVGLVTTGEDIQLAFAIDRSIGASIGATDILFKNGCGLPLTDGGTGLTGDPGNDIVIGRRFGGGQQLNGALLDAIFFHRKISPDEITLLYDQSLRGYPDLINRVPTIRYFFPAVAHTFYDTFVDTAGTSLDAHTPDIGSNWTEQQGNFTISTSGEVTKE